MAGLQALVCQQSWEGRGVTELLWLALTRYSRRQSGEQPSGGPHVG